jgi:hypothetical protein
MPESPAPLAAARVRVRPSQAPWCPSLPAGGSASPPRPELEGPGPPGPRQAAPPGPRQAGPDSRRQSLSRSRAAPARLGSESGPGEASGLSQPRSGSKRRGDVTERDGEGGTRMARRRRRGRAGRPASAARYARRVARSCIVVEACVADPSGQSGMQIQQLEHVDEMGVMEVEGGQHWSVALCTCGNKRCVRLA